MFHGVRGGQTAHGTGTILSTLGCIGFDLGRAEGLGGKRSGSGFSTTIGRRRHWPRSHVVLLSRLPHFIIYLVSAVAAATSCRRRGVFAADWHSSG